MSDPNVFVQQKPMVVWTALPNGRAGNVLNVTVAVSLRLGRPDGASAPLSSYVGDVSLLSVLTWPNVVTNLANLGRLNATVTVTSGGTTKSITPRSTTLTSSPDLAFYQRLFTGAMNVACFTYTKSAGYNVLASYTPSTIINGVLQGRAPQMSQRGFSDERRRAIRAAGALALALDPSHESVPDHADAELRDLWATVANDAFALEVFRGARHVHLADIARRRVPGQVRLASRIEAVVPPTPGPTPGRNPPPDFHALLGMLASYPTLQRRLGFVFDLALDVGPIDDNAEIVTLVQPDVRATDFAAWDQRWVQVSGVTAGGTLAFPTANFPYKGPALDLTDATTYTVESLDADSAFAKTIQAAASGGAIPSLKSGGLTVYHNGRTTELARAMGAADLLNDQLVNPTVYSDGTIAPILADLRSITRGYRVDVNDGTRWYSLCARHVDMTIGGASVVFDDEGWIKASALTAALADPSIFQVHVALFGWDGYSLVAPRPRVDGAPTPPSTDPWGLGVTTNAITPAPGSLPRLRYGKSYRFRARAVDVAGNSVKLGDPSDTSGTSQYGAPSAIAPYLRHELVPTPALRPRAPMTEGESVERLVIRSSPADGKSVTDMLALLDAAPDKVAPFAASSERHVAPPHASLPMCEFHGVLDTTGAAGYAAVAQKAAGSFDDPTAFLALTGATPSLFSTLVTPPFSASTTNSSYWINATPDGTATLPVPYLPDPNAANFALNDHPNKFDTSRIYPLGTTLRPWSGSWPDLETFLLRLQPGTTPSVDAGAGSSAMTVYLPPGMTITALYSSALAGTGLAPIGADTMSDYVRYASPALLADALDGTLSPRRAITFVHAVLRPAAGPTNAGVTVTRAHAGDTFATIQGKLNATAYDTGAIAIEASWTEPAAPPYDGSPIFLPHSGHVTKFPLDYADHVVPEQIPPSLVYQNAQGVEVTVPMRHELGDTKCRTVTYTFVGHTRYKEYFPPSLTADPSKITTAGDTLTVTIPSSARPAPLRVLEVVPTFRFDAVTNGRRRVGGGLRVYVDGDWFSSGEGERLAVVLRGDPATPYEQYDGRVSGSGGDPIWAQAGSPTPLDVAHFHPPGSTPMAPLPGGPPSSLVASVETGVPMPDLPSGTTRTLTLVTYDPQYNAERGLWYFDLEVDPDQLHLPFLRLALARYQKSSLTPTLALSKIVVADIAQIVPHRTATIVSKGAGAYDVELLGFVGSNVTYTLPTGGITLSPYIPAPKAASGRVVEVEVQATTSPSSDFGAPTGTPPVPPDPKASWATISGPTPLAPYVSRMDVGTAQEGMIHFRATIIVPPTAIPSGATVRVVFREKERFTADADGSAAGTAVIHIGKPAETYQERVIYTDFLALP